MSEPGIAAQRQQIRQPGWVARMMTLPLRFLGMLCGSLMLSILLECIGMQLLWPDQGWHHAQRMLNDELAQVSEHFTRSAMVHEPGRTALWMTERVYDRLFLRTGLLDWITNASAKARAGSGVQHKDFRHYLGWLYVHLERCLIAAAYTALVFWVRVLVLCLTLPLFVMAGFVGFVDGLVRRDIRRFGAGRESGFLYHRAKAILMPLIVLPWVSYLALPVSVSPMLILLPSAVLLGLAVNIAAGSFKKYL